MNNFEETVTGQQLVVEMGGTSVNYDGGSSDERAVHEQSGAEYFEFAGVVTSVGSWGAEAASHALAEREAQTQVSVGANPPIASNSNFVDPFAIAERHNLVVDGLRLRTMASAGQLDRFSDHDLARLLQCTEGQVWAEMRAQAIAEAERRELSRCVEAALSDRNAGGSRNRL